MTTFLKVGHRGARAYETENTLASFRKAIALGANAVEFDVRISGDGELILLHDDNLKRVFGRDVPVNGATLKELKEQTGGRIATLDEALRDIGSRVEKILVELKEPGYEDKVVGTLGRMHLTDRAIVVSFHEESLARVKDLDRTIETGLVYTKLSQPLDAALRLGARYILPLYRFVHAAHVRKAHKKGLKVIVWTINSEKEARNYRAKDVDGIATDKPEILSGIT